MHHATISGTHFNGSDPGITAEAGGQRDGSQLHSAFGGNVERFGHLHYEVGRDGPALRPVNGSRLVVGPAFGRAGIGPCRQSMDVRIGELGRVGPVTVVRVGNQGGILWVSTAALMALA